VSENEDPRAKVALLGAARTIARAATIDPNEAEEFSADDTIHSSAHKPIPVTTATTLDETGPRYERQSLLGEGGMGQVWLMRDVRVGRRVAMKMIRIDTGGTDAGGKARFLREARVQGQLEHPAVVPVYDLGTTPDGDFFFTMKRVRGSTLSEVIHGLGHGDAKLIERYSERRLLTAFSQVCLAVEFAHARGVLHRDLKPDNLMLGDHGEVYVLDWGVARVLRDDLDSDDEMGMSSSDALKAAVAAGDNTGLVGTPGYIAPEKLRGKAIGPTADVYALGAILFELLTLRSLIGDGNVLARLERTISGVDAGAIIAGLERKVSPELTALCVRATALDPVDRIQTARALHEAIEAYLDGERDQQMRRELAEHHLDLAREAMAQSSEDLEAHKRALRETGRALAIVPDHPEARKLILELFASTPKVAPPEVEAAIEAERTHQARLSAKTGAAGMASMLLFIPILMLFGIRSWLGIGLFAAMAVGAVAVSAVAAQQKARSSALLYLVVFFNNLVFGMCAGLYGPLVLVPAMVITNTITFVLHLDGWARRFAIASGVLAVALPLLLTACGILPSSYVPSGDGILMRPLWLAFPPNATLAFITVGTLIAIVNGARSVSQVREALTQAERRTQMQRWQLSQLLPEDRDQA